MLSRDLRKGLKQAIKHDPIWRWPQITVWFILQWRSLSREFDSCIKRGEIWIGPFYGEFGHLLLHLLPFLIYLSKHERIRTIHLCTNEVYAPFLIQFVDSSKLNLTRIKDQIGSFTPNSNSLPQEIGDDDKKTIQSFMDRLNANGGINLLDGKFYWSVFRNWTLANGYQACIEASRIPERSSPKIILFPRKKGAAITKNNGGPWEYPKIATELLTYGEVVIAGHPNLSFTEGFPPDVSYAWSNDHIIDEMKSADLVVTQHSGACILGDYFDVDTLIIYNGTPPILGLDETHRFRRLIQRGNFYFAYQYGELTQFLKKRYPHYEKTRD